MVDINDLRQQRATLAAQARALLTAAEAANRDITADESQTFDRLMTEADALEQRINRETALREQERRVAENAPVRQDAPEGDENAELQARAWRTYLVGGPRALAQDPELERALQAGSDPEGGFLVAPQQWVQQLIQGVDDAVPLRGLCNTMQLTEGESLGVPTLETDLNDAEWTTELSTGSQDDSLRIGKREFRPNPVRKRVKISRTLLRRASMDPETIVRARMAYKFGVTQEKAFMTGDGNKKPLGLFVASTDGIPTSRDVATGSATNVTGDGLIDAKYTLKAAYWSRARWLFHRDAIRRIRKEKTTTDGQYVWQPGLSGDRPDTILEVPYVVSEWVPNTFTDGNYVGMIGDFSYYWIADALDMQIQRLVELYAETNQVGFIGEMETDGAPVLAEAFVRVKCATS